MPVMDGLEMTKRLKKKNKDVDIEPIEVVHTGDEIETLYECFDNMLQELRMPFCTAFCPQSG